MKVKVLKKLRKRYDWYFNTDGFPVLIDHIKKTVTLYDVEYLCQRNNYKVEDLPTLVKVEHTEWALRVMKWDLLQEWGWNISRVRYRIATRKLKNKQPK